MEDNLRLPDFSDWPTFNEYLQQLGLKISNILDDVQYIGMNKEYRITLKQQFSVFSYIWIRYALIFLAYFYLFGFTTDNNLLPFLLIIISIDLLPVIILHFQYFLINNRSVFIVNKIGRTAVYKRDTVDVSFSFDDIESLKFVLSYGGISAPGWYAFGDYRYCIIILKDKKQIVLTCLMVHDIVNTLELLFGIKAEKKYKILPLLPKKENRI